jgi:hypothetical protein
LRGCEPKSGGVERVIHFLNHGDTEDTEERMDGGEEAAAEMQRVETRRHGEAEKGGRKKVLTPTFLRVSASLRFQCFVAGQVRQEAE